MLRKAYGALSFCAGPFLKAWLHLRVLRGKEIGARIPERYGVADTVRPQGSLVWIHAASVGESLSALPLISALEAQAWQVLITTGTVSSAEVLKDRLPQNTIHQFAPLDRRSWVDRFCTHWRPNLVLWMESELWPNTLSVITKRSIPAALVNGRLSDRAYSGWQRQKKWAHRVLSCFSLVLAQSDEDARRFSDLGSVAVHAVGNLKYASDALPVDIEKLDSLRSEVQGRSVWLAASIHPGEDALVARAHNSIKRHHPSLLTILIPRHAHRGSSMSGILSAAGLTTKRQSETHKITSDTDAFVADTMGELGLYYSLCDIVFLGKSLAVGGGQNPMEPAHFNCAILFGPDMSNFKDIAADLLNVGGAREVADAEGLATEVSHLIADEPARTKMADAAKRAIAQRKNVLAETLDHLKPYLAQSSP